MITDRKNTGIEMVKTNTTSVKDAIIRVITIEKSISE